MAQTVDKRPSGYSKHIPFQVGQVNSLSQWLPRFLRERPTRFNLPAPITLLIIAGVLAAALAAPRIAANEDLTLLVIAVILGAAGFFILERLPVLGFLALIPVSLVLPFSLGTGAQTGINGSILLIAGLCGLWVLDWIGRDKQVRLLPYRPLKVAFIFCIVSIIAFGFGQFRWFPAEPAPMRAQLGGLGIFIVSAAAMFLAAHRIQSFRDLEWIVWLFLAFGGLYVIIRTVPFLYPYYTKVFVRHAAQGAVFYVWLASLGVAQVFFNPKLDTRIRWLIVAMLIGLLYLNMGVSRAWVSGWLPPLIGVWVVLLIGRPQLGVIATLIGALLMLLFSSTVAGVFVEGDNVYSYVTRLEAWRILWEIIKVNPVFGVGMANYYWYTPLFSILGYHVNFNSHNNYIDLAAQVGIVGVLVFFWWFWETWRFGWNLYARAPEGFPRAYTLGALGGLVGTLAAGVLGDWVIPFVYNIGLNGFRASVFAFFFLGGMLAIARILDETKEAPAA